MRVYHKAINCNRDYFVHLYINLDMLYLYTYIYIYVFHIFMYENIHFICIHRHANRCIGSDEYKHIDITMAHNIMMIYVYITIALHIPYTQSYSSYWGTVVTLKYDSKYILSYEIMKWARVIRCLGASITTSTSILKLKLHIVWIFP